MSYDGIRDALKTRLDALSGVGPIYTYERQVVANINDPEFITAFTESATFNFGWIDRLRFQDMSIVGEDSRYRRRHEVAVRFYHALNDASTTGETFDDFLDTIMTDLEEGDHTFGGACATCGEPRVVDIASGMFAQTLCHIAEIEMTFEEVLT